MSLLAEFKSKPLIVQKLTCIWFVFAFYGLAFSCAAGIFTGAWSSVPWTTFFCLIVLLLSWGHLKQLKVAWYFGVAISFFWCLVNPIVAIGVLGALVRSGFGLSDLLSTEFYIAPWWSWGRLLLALNFHTITGFVLMSLAVVFARSKAGRLAYGIPLLVRPTKRQSREQIMSKEEKDRFLIL